MSKKWPNVPEEKRKRIFAYNQARARDAQKAVWLTTLLSRLPPGIVKQLYKDPECAEILRQNGIEQKGGTE